MLDAVFRKLPFDRINEWNRNAKFSRAVLQTSPKGDYTTLESNLDLIGGVTEGAPQAVLLVVRRRGASSFIAVPRREPRPTTSLPLP